MHHVSFLDRVEGYMLQQKMLHPYDGILAGFSGGADSTCLLYCLWRLRDRYRLNLLAVHVNYQMRGQASEEDEEFVRNFCFSRNIPLVSHRYKGEKDAGFESAAREFRFQLFRTLQKSYGMCYIALGHHREDQAETVLMRLMRGSAVSGMKGIMPVLDEVIHPLLDLHSDEIRDFLRDEEIDWREDHSNSQIRYQRNLVRHQLIPWIQNNVNPRIVDKLCESATVFARTDQVMRDIVETKLQKHGVSHTDSSWRISLKILGKMNPALRFYLYREVFQRLNGEERNFYSVHGDRIEELLTSRGSKRFDLPGDIVVIKEYEELVFIQKENLNDSDLFNEREITDIRGVFSFESMRLRMKKLKQLPRKRGAFEDPDIGYFDYDRVVFPLVLRHRRPGDRFIPFGMENRKKLKDFFIDEKVPKFDRDKIVLLCDQEKILWVCGYRTDQRVAVQEDTRCILMVRTEPVVSARPRSAERKRK